MKESVMKYHNITHDDMLNGEGLRKCLWVAGCEHQCEGCQNACTWNPNIGLEFGDEAESELFYGLEKNWVSGVTFSGGDPLFRTNRARIGQLAKKIKILYPEKTIWLYTGYKMDFENGEAIFVNEVSKQTFSIDWLKYVDVVIDGRYDERIRKEDINNHRKVLWRGSSNQRIIDIAKSLEMKRIEEYDCEYFS